MITPREIVEELSSHWRNDGLDVDNTENLIDSIRIGVNRLERFILRPTDRPLLRPDLEVILEDAARALAILKNEGE